MRGTTAAAIGGATAGVAGVAAAIYSARKMGPMGADFLARRDKVTRVDYYSLTIANEPGTGFDLLAKLKESGVNLLAYTAFPIDNGRTKVSLVPEDPEALFEAAQKFGLSLSPRKDAFFVRGKTRVGAAAEVLHKLAVADINLTASCGAQSNGDYGLMLWVKSENVHAAAKALGV